MKRVDTISSLFDGQYSFRVPAYQRAYAWEETQLKQFVEDIEEHPADKPYYLGHFLFESAGPESLYVIDGQQRLSTIVLFFAAVIQNLRARGKIELVAELRDRYIQREGATRFRTVDNDIDLFEGLILRGEIPSVVKTRSGANIISAWRFFCKRLAAVGPDHVLVWARVLGEAQITQFVVNDKVQATQIFTLQNSRGKQLTSLEQLKAYLMYQAYLNSPKGRENQIISDIERQFAEIYTCAEKIQVMKEDAVLRHHDHAYSTHWGQPTDNLKSDLSHHSAPEDRIRILTDYARELKESFHHVVAIEGLLDHHEIVADPVILDAANSWPLLISLFRWSKGNIVDDPGIRVLLDDVETTLIKFSFQHGRSSNDLIGDCKLFNKNGNLTELRQRYDNCAQNSFRGRGDFNQRVLNYLTGHYHYDGTCRYILWKYENSLRLPKDHRLSPLEYLNRVAPKRMDSTIEHIAPQNPVGEPYSLEFIDRHLNNIGNLLLMPLGFNASEGNRPPEQKAESFAHSSYASHREVHKLINTPCPDCGNAWCGHKIELRQQSIIGFAIGRWKLTAPESPSDPQNPLQERITS